MEGNLGLAFARELGGWGSEQGRAGQPVLADCLLRLSGLQPECEAASRFTGGGDYAVAVAQLFSGFRQLDDVQLSSLG